MERGRPREHDREQIAKDMIEWSKKPDSINFNKFCAYYEPIIPPSKLLQWSKEDESFRAAYECAKMFLGFRREEWLNYEKLHVKAYDLNATVYDYFLKDEKRQQQEFESNLKNNEEDKKNTNNLSLLFKVQSEVEKNKKLIKE